MTQALEFKIYPRQAGHGPAICSLEALESESRAFCANIGESPNAKMVRSKRSHSFLNGSSHLPDGRDGQVVCHLDPLAEYWHPRVSNLQHCDCGNLSIGGQHSQLPFLVEQCQTSSSKRSVYARIPCMPA